METGDILRVISGAANCRRLVSVLEIANTVAISLAATTFGPCEPSGNGGDLHPRRPAINSAEIGVRQHVLRPSQLHSDGHWLTLGGNIASTDNCYVVFQAAAVGLHHPATAICKQRQYVGEGDLTRYQYALRVDSAKPFGCTGRPAGTKVREREQVNKRSAWRMHKLALGIGASSFTVMLAAHGHAVNSNGDRLTMGIWTRS